MMAEEALATGGRADPRLAPNWRVRGVVTGQDTVLVRGSPFRLDAGRVFYAWLLESATVAKTYALLIRGTGTFIEWLIDAEFLPRKAHPVAGEVEIGFWDLYETLRYIPAGTQEELPLSAIAREVGSGWLTVAGHSLGAALATFVAFDLAAELGAHLQGFFIASPRPGDGAFAKAFADRVPRHLMLRNVKDIVPDVPFGFGYRSVPNVVELSATDSGVELTGGLAGQHHALVYGMLCDPTLYTWFTPMAAEAEFVKCITRPTSPHIRSFSIMTTATTTSVPYFVAEALTAAAISAGSSAADKQARAKVASTVAAFFTAAGSGDIAGANSEVATAIAGISDPGLQKVATDLWSAGQPFIQAQLQVTENVPVLGGSLTQALTDVGAGMASAAGAYLTQAKKAGT